MENKVESEYTKDKNTLEECATEKLRWRVFGELV